MPGVGQQALLTVRPAPRPAMNRLDSTPGGLMLTTMEKDNVTVDRESGPREEDAWTVKGGLE